jgi:hypothetical protein
VDAELVRFIGGLASAGLCGAVASYFAARRGVASALQEHRDRLVVLETWRGGVDEDRERFKDALWPARARR